MSRITLFLISLFFSLGIYSQETPTYSECVDNAQDLGKTPFDRRCLQVFKSSNEFKFKVIGDYRISYNKGAILIAKKTNGVEKLSLISGSKTKLTNIINISTDSIFENLLVLDCEATCNMKVFPLKRFGNIVPIKWIESSSLKDEGNVSISSLNGKAIWWTGKNIQELSLTEDYRLHKKVTVPSSNYKLPFDCDEINAYGEDYICLNKTSKKVSLLTNKGNSTLDVKDEVQNIDSSLDLSDYMIENDKIKRQPL